MAANIIGKNNKNTVNIPHENGNDAEAEVLTRVLYVRDVGCGLQDPYNQPNV